MKLTYQDALFYMFDIPQEFQNNEFVMLNWRHLQLEKIKKYFYKNNVDFFNNFSIIKNIHADYLLGVYLVHNDFVKYLKNTDDFNILFNLKDYNEAKKFNTINSVYCLETEYNKFKHSNCSPVKHSLYHHKNKKDFKLKTKWHIVLVDDKATALISERDGLRFINRLESDYKNCDMFKVSSFEEGMDYFKKFQ